MKAPGPGTFGSLALHAGLGALLFLSWPDKPMPPPPEEGIRVSVISDVQVEAAAADNPSEELIVEDGASAPPEPVDVPPTPEPTPAPPQPTPQPRRPTPTPPPTPRPAEKRPTPTPTPTPPRTQPQPRPSPPAPSREEPSLDLDRLSKRPNEGRTNRRANTGDAGRGQAPRALGRADLSFLARQITVSCTPAFRDADVQVQISIRLTESGRLARAPRRISPRSDAGYRAMADAVERAVQVAAPFDMPAGYDEQDVTLQFSSRTSC